MTLKRKGCCRVGLLVAALALVAAGCGGGRRRRSGAGGAAVVVVHGDRVRGRRETRTYILASDFPLQGSSRTQTMQIVEAIRYLLEKSDCKAGDYNIGLPVVRRRDGAGRQVGLGQVLDERATPTPANDKVVGVIGTFNSGCAAIIIPVLNQAPDGGIAMISPANTYVCLTEGGPGCDATEPDKYYPSGSAQLRPRRRERRLPGRGRGRVRQGAGRQERLHPQRQGGLRPRRRDELPERGRERSASRSPASTAWDPKASSYEALFNKIKATGADAVFLGGLIDENGAQVIKDKVAVLGPNDGDGQAVRAGRVHDAADDRRGGPGLRPGMFMSRRRRADRRVQGRGRRSSSTAFKPAARRASRSTRTRSTARRRHRSCSTRSRRRTARARDVIAKMFEHEGHGRLARHRSRSTRTAIRSGAEGAVVGFTIYKATDKLETVKTISPKPEDVDAARGLAARGHRTAPKSAGGHCPPRRSL